MKHLLPLQEFPTSGEQDLFDICSNRHRGAETSVLAHEKIKAHKSKQREKVYEFIRACANRGATVDEIAAAWGVGSNQVSGRVTELLRDGLIVRDGKTTRPTRSNCSASVLVVACPNCGRSPNYCNGNCIFD
jgi:hypothetical protein